MGFYTVTYSFTFFVEADNSESAEDESFVLAAEEFGHVLAKDMNVWVDELSADEAAACGFEVEE